MPENDEPNSHPIQCGPMGGTNHAGRPPDSGDKNNEHMQAKFEVGEVQRCTATSFEKNLGPNGSLGAHKLILKLIAGDQGEISKHRLKTESQDHHGNAGAGAGATTDLPIPPQDGWSSF